MDIRAAAVLPLLLLPGPLFSQDGDRDSGRLVVRRGDVVIGEEEFSLEVAQDADGARAVTLIVSATYQGEGSRRAAATFGARRITVRISSGGTELAREYPRGERDLVVHEGLLGLLAIAGQLEPGAVTVFTPPAPGRRSASLEHLGTERPDAAGSPLRHVAIRGTGAPVELWFDERRRLMRVALPDRGVVAERTGQP